MIWRCLPPYGNGIAAPWTVASCGADEVDAEVEELLLGQALPRQRELEDRHVDAL